MSTERPLTVFIRDFTKLHKTGVKLYSDLSEPDKSVLLFILGMMSATLAALADPRGAEEMRDSILAIAERALARTEMQLKAEEALHGGS